MVVSSATHSVTTSATKIIDTDEDSLATVVYNPDTNPTVYWGGSDVTTSIGIPIPPGGKEAFDLRGVGDDVYIIAGSACTVRKGLVT
jgi:hypothetical protein